MFKANINDHTPDLVVSQS